MVEEILLYWGIYMIGFFITLVFLVFFGKKLGFDYDPPHPPDYDDYETSGHAYLAFSFGWFLFIPVLIIYTGGVSLIRLINKSINAINKSKR